MKRIAVLSALIFIALLARSPVIAQETAAPDAQKTTKTKSAMSWQTISQKMKEYKSTMKEIARNAEKSLKKIDEEKKLRESKKASAKHLNDEKESEKKALKEAAAKAKTAARQKAAQEAAAKAKLSADAKAAERAATKAKKEAEKKAAQEAAATAKAKKEAEKKAAQEAAVKAKVAARQKAAEEAAAKANREVEKKRAEEAAIRSNGELEQITIKKVPAKAKTLADIKKEPSAPATGSSETAQKATPAALVSIPIPYAGQRHLIDEPTPEIQAPVASEEVSAMYRDAVALYWDNKYSEAKAKFEQVQKALPEYARTGYYLGRVKEKLNK